MNNNYGEYHPYYATDVLVPNGYTKMFHSDFESFPWISVDLLDILTILFVRFYNRVDGSGNIFILLVRSLKGDERKI